MGHLQLPLMIHTPVIIDRLTALR